MMGRLLTTIALLAATSSGMLAQAQSHSVVAGGNLDLSFISNPPTTSTQVTVAPAPPIPWWTTSVTSNSPKAYLVVPTATLPGSYSVLIGSTSFTVTVTALPPLPASNYPPVVLVDGFSILGAVTGAQPNLPDSVTNYWDLLPQYLQNEGRTWLYFQNAHECHNMPIEGCAYALQGFLDAQTNADGTPVAQFDIITHSMGGLIARSYLAGYFPQGWYPRADTKVRKLILLGSPNFGAISTITTNNVQANEMIPGSEYLWEQGTWNQNYDDLRGVDAIAVAGNGYTGKIANGPLASTSDGVVPLVSASIQFTRAPGNTRIIPYCHMQQICGTTPGLNWVDNPSHLTWVIADSFLNDTATWQSQGHDPTQDPIIATKGAIIAKLIGSDGLPMVNSAYQSSLLSLNNAGPITINFTTSSGQMVQVSTTIQPGFVEAFSLKYGPILGKIFNPDAPGNLTLISGGPVTIVGTALTGSNGTAQLWANENQIPVTIKDSGELDINLPSIYTGIIWWTIKTDQGEHVIRSVVRQPGQQ